MPKSREVNHNAGFGASRNAAHHAAGFGESRREVGVFAEQKHESHRHAAGFGDSLSPLRIGILLVLTSLIACARPPLQSTVHTPENAFTPGIEGPAVGPDGRLYAVNFEREGTIGVVEVDGRASLFAALPDSAVGNGIRFDRSGNLYLADYVGHRVWRVDHQDKRPYIWAENPAMNQPNDLAIAPNGTIYLSDPNWKAGTGRIWRINESREIELLADSLGTTNGIEVSPDGRFLYVNESVQRRLWRFEIQSDGRLGVKTLLRSWPDHGLDGMRCDVRGNLYVTRYDAGLVEVLTPSGKTRFTIALVGRKPSNIAFGGVDGRTAYVTLADKGWVETFRTKHAGRER